MTLFSQDMQQRSPGKRRRWPIILFLLAAAIIAWFFFGGSDDNARHGKGKRQGQTPVVTVTAALRKDVPVTLDGLATVQAYNTVTVRSQVDGQLIAIEFKEGQDVKKGDVLARIDPRSYQAQLSQAEANRAKEAAALENAKRDLQRYINAGDTVSGQTVDTQRANVRQQEAAVLSAQAAVDNAKTLLSYTTIISPIDGRTGIRQIDVGNIVHAGDAAGIVVITQVQPISLLFSLPQQHLPDINAHFGPDKPLTVLALESNSREILDEGSLELVDNQIDQATGTVKLKATFANAKRNLWPGGFANARLMLTVRENSLVVPVTAVQRGPKDAYVFVLKEDKTVEMRTVKTAMMTETDAVIAEGLQDGEQVVTDGAGKLQDGSKVLLADEEAKTPDKRSP